MTRDVKLHAGEPVAGRTVYPVYVDNQLAIPAGSEVMGIITQVLPAPGQVRLDAKMHGDFTPLRQADVQFKDLFLTGGRQISISAPPSADGMHLVRLRSADAALHRRSWTSRLWSSFVGHEHEAVNSVTAPGKWGRAKKLLYSELPLHPQSLSAGLLYSVKLDAPVEVPLSSPRPTPDRIARQKLEQSAVISARLRTDLDSRNTKRGAVVEAVVTEPLLNEGGQVAVPQGTILSGRVTQNRPSGKWGRSGILRFGFYEMRFPAGFRQPVHGSASSIDANQRMNLQMDAEGGVKPDRGGLIVPLAMGLLASSALHEDESTIMHTAGASNGFALIGRVVALASGSRYVGAGIGIFSTGRILYHRFIGRGTDVEFPRDTRIEIAVDPVNSPVMRMRP